MRALAVLAVFGYHAGVGWMPGGFLGVDVFFVISGYLITSLLLREFRRGGHIASAASGCGGRAACCPRVGVLIAVDDDRRRDRPARTRSTSSAATRSPRSSTSPTGTSSSTTPPTSNSSGGPRCSRHLWSLSVEEQFYLFWPLVFAAGMKLFGRRRLLLGVLAGALGSVALAWILFDPGDDASRVYYGTDTHAVGLLLGVALALVWSPVELRRQSTGPLVGPILDALGVVALGYLVLSFIHVHDYDLALWHGGYLWLALVTALLIAVLAHPAARLGGIIGRPPLLWLGLRSYSFYLWHWPVLALTRPGRRHRLPRGILIPLQLHRRASPSPTSPTASSSCPSTARRSCRGCRRAGCAWRARR